MISCGEIIRFQGNLGHKKPLAEKNSEMRARDENGVWFIVKSRSTKEIDPNDIVRGYVKDENNFLYEIETRKKFVPNYNRSSIFCAEFARYFCYEGTVDSTRDRSKLGHTVKFKRFYKSKISALASGREKEGLFGFDIDGRIVENFDKGKE